jgi:hypothetical protein
MNIQDKILAIKEELNKLQPHVIESIVFDLLMTGVIDYVSLSEMYVSSLKKINWQEKTRNILSC